MVDFNTTIVTDTPNENDDSELLKQVIASKVRMFCNIKDLPYDMFTEGALVNDIFNLILQVSFVNSDEADNADTTNS